MEPFGNQQRVARLFSVNRFLRNETHDFLRSGDSQRLFGPRMLMQNGLKLCTIPAIDIKQIRN